MIPATEGAERFYDSEHLDRLPNGLGYGGAYADEVKIQHALDSPGLQTAVVKRSARSIIVEPNHGNALDEASRLIVEEIREMSRTQRPAWSLESGDVVVCGDAGSTLVADFAICGRHCTRHPGQLEDARLA